MTDIARPDASRLDVPDGIAHITIDHRLPLSSTRCAFCALPHDITQAEVERIARWLRTLPLDDFGAERPGAPGAAGAQQEEAGAQGPPAAREG